MIQLIDDIFLEFEKSSVFFSSFHSATHLRVTSQYLEISKNVYGDLLFHFGLP